MDTHKRNHHTQTRRVIPIQERVAVALWRLTNGNSFKTISRILATGNSTAVEIFPNYYLTHLSIGKKISEDQK